MKAKRSIITTLAVLTALLFVGVSTPSARAIPSDPIPATITANSTHLVLYFWGVIDGMVQAEALSPNGPVSLRMAAHQSRMTAMLFLGGGAPQAFSYFWGRADGFDQAADAAGEPR